MTNAISRKKIITTPKKVTQGNSVCQMRFERFQEHDAIAFLLARSVDSLALFLFAALGSFFANYVHRHVVLLLGSRCAAAFGHVLIHQRREPGDDFGMLGVFVHALAHILVHVIELTNCFDRAALAPATGIFAELQFPWPLSDGEYPADGVMHDGLAHGFLCGAEEHR